MFFFSKALIDDSLKTGKVKEKDMYLIHWGADLDFYDRMRNEAKDKEFISTGKENRDLATLLQLSAIPDWNSTSILPQLTVTRNMRKSPTGFKGKTISIST